MKFLIALSLKNLWRYRRRTLITAAAIAAGIMLFVWMDAFLLGVEKESERSTILYETGSAQIMDSEYYKNIQYLPLKNVINDPDRLLAALNKLNIPATKRVSFSGEIFYGGKSSPLRFYAIDHDTYGRVFRLDEALAKGGSFIREGRNEIMIGEELADTLGASIGDQVDIRTRTRTGTSQTMTLAVSGLLNSLNVNLNVAAGILPLDVADRELEMNGSVTEIPVLIPEYKNVHREMAEIRTNLGPEMQDREIHAWDEISGELMKIMGGKRKAIFLMLFLLGIIAAVGISNTMLIAVFERIKEIGMMRAMGMADKQIRISFLLEAGWIGLIGSLMGVAMGVGLIAYTTYVGIDFGYILQNFDVGINIPTVFHAAWNFETIVLAPIIGVIISAFVALFPAKRALKMDITECLRHQ
ncbi:MAG: ABC transporter permease [Spirochaetales bacterium]|nr:ABC transporter permease [Spirochaetales bacterium]